MVKAATSGQARAFGAMVISRIDEEALKKIDSEKLQRIIDQPEAFLHNLLGFINNDSHFLAGPLCVNLEDQPKLRFNSDEILKHEGVGRILFESGRIKLVKAPGTEGALCTCAQEFKKLLKLKEGVVLGNANVLEFFENYQYDTKVSEFLERYKKEEGLYQLGTLYKGFSHNLVSRLKWNGRLWFTESFHFDDNFIIKGPAFVIQSS